MPFSQSEYCRYIFGVRLQGATKQSVKLKTENLILRTISQSVRVVFVRLDYAIVEPEEDGRTQADGCEGPEEEVRLVADFAEAMQERSANATGYEGADAERQERKAHVRALLA